MVGAFIGYGILSFGFGTAFGAFVVLAAQLGRWPFHAKR